MRGNGRGWVMGIPYREGFSPRWPGEQRAKGVQYCHPAVTVRHMDWMQAAACAGVPWIDAALLMPHLADGAQNSNPGTASYGLHPFYIENH